MSHETLLRYISLYLAEGGDLKGPIANFVAWTKKRKFIEELEEEVVKML